MSTTAKRKINGRKAFIAATAVAAAAGAITLPVQGAAAAETGAPTCEMATLPIPDGQLFTFTTGMSDDGSAVVYRGYPTDGGYERFPMMYIFGEAHAVPIPGEDQEVSDVNSTGFGSGSTYIDGRVLPYIVQEGKVAQLSWEDGGEANGVNEHNDVVGARGQYPQVPVFAPGFQGTVIDLPLPEGAGSGSASEINDEGVIVGHYEDAEGDFVPYWWDADLNGAPLPMPEGVDPGEAHAYASDIQGDWASGFLSAPGLDAVGVVWNLAEGTAHLTDLEGRATVNAKGTVAGDLYPSAAFQTFGGEVVTLPGVAEPSDDHFGDQADQISADGTTIAGSVYVGRDENDRHLLNAVVWTCE